MLETKVKDGTLIVAIVENKRIVVWFRQYFFGDCLIFFCVVCCFAHWILVLCFMHFFCILSIIRFVLNWALPRFHSWLLMAIFRCRFWMYCFILILSFHFRVLAVELLRIFRSTLNALLQRQNTQKSKQILAKWWEYKTKSGRESQ